MHNVSIALENINYTVYFFGSFSGHTHPFTPIDPLEFDEIGAIGIPKHGSSVYYQGWYSETDKGPRLDRLLKYSLLGVKYENNFDKVSTPGVYYHRIENEKNNWIVKELIKPEAVLNQQHYFRYEINKEGKLESAYHIYSSLMNSYIYSYHSNGLLEKVEKEINRPPSKIPGI